MKFEMLQFQRIPYNNVIGLVGSMYGRVAVIFEKNWDLFQIFKNVWKIIFKKKKKTRITIQTNIGHPNAKSMPNNVFHTI